MKKSVIVIISVIVSLLLLACCFVVGINRSAESGEAYLIVVDLDETFEIEDVASLVKEAGATDVTVEKEIYSSGAYGTIADIFFTAEDATAVCEKADELLSNKYFLMGDCTLYTASASLTKSSVISMWPAAIVLVILLAYMYIRFGCSFGTTSLIAAIEAVAATAGIIAAVGLRFNSFTCAVVLASGALALMLTIVLAVVSKHNAKKEISVEQNIKSFVPTSLLTVCVLAVALVLVAIFGQTSIIKAFAIQGLIAVAVNALIALFVTPACAVAFSKKK